MKVCVASSSLVSEFAINTLLRSEQVDLIGLITNPDKATGRGQNIKANSLAQWAQSQKITVEKPNDNEQLKETLQKLNPDLVITIAYGRLIPITLLNLPKYGFINLHYSILPKYRGAAPVQHAIMDGLKSTGVSIFQLDSGMDTGPIYAQQECEITNEDVTSTLIEKLNRVGVDLLSETLSKIQSEVSPIPQSEKGISYAPKISKEEGHINWSENHISVHNRYRALSENPGVFTIYQGQRVRINQMIPAEITDLKIGSFTVIDGKFFVGTSGNSLEIIKLTPEGRKMMSGLDFYNGLSDQSVKSFG
ncbi:MAG: methionyl-tRNA formyltransferase [Actinobacteria bacterium]|uniref:methionyl-tRNA formyltransferase n=1 Tax=freshwater metagenome TaxID=449393 RepID=A0A6J6PKC5_9ZZZZ|nr:methionyl-tRNA formyltransferase [Actinomycetota bacterium]